MRRHCRPITRMPRPALHPVYPAHPVKLCVAGELTGGHGGRGLPVHPTADTHTFPRSSSIPRRGGPCGRLPRIYHASPGEGRRRALRQTSAHSLPTDTLLAIFVGAPPPGRVICCCIQLFHRFLVAISPISLEQMGGASPWARPCVILFKLCVAGELTGGHGGRGQAPPLQQRQQRWLPMIARPGM